MLMFFDPLMTLLFVMVLERVDALECDSLGAYVGVVLVCYFGGWGLESMLPDLAGGSVASRSFTATVWLSFAAQFVSLVFPIIVASTVIPAIHIRSFIRLVVATVFFLVIRYAVMVYLL